MVRFRHQKMLRIIRIMLEFWTGFRFATRPVSALIDEYTRCPLRAHCWGKSMAGFTFQSKVREGSRLPSHVTRDVVRLPHYAMPGGKGNCHKKI